MQKPPLHMVLFQPEIPYNTGSVGRTCVATGCKLWLVRPLGFRLNDYYLRRAGLDYWQHLDVEVVDGWDELAEKLPLQRAWFLTKKATQYYHQVSYSAGDVLVLGCESLGLPDWMLKQHPHRQLRIPVAEQVRSLNLSNAAAVVMYEALRQMEINIDLADASGRPSTD